MAFKWDESEDRIKVADYIRAELGLLDDADQLGHEKYGRIMGRSHILPLPAAAQSNTYVSLMTQYVNGSSARELLLT